MTAGNAGPSWRHTCLLTSILAVGLGGRLEARTTAALSPTLQYVRTMSAVLDQLESELPAITAAAEQAAARLVNNGYAPYGKLLVAYQADLPAPNYCFAHEAVSRAGGMARTDYAYPSTSFRPRDLLLTDDLDMSVESRRTCMRAARSGGALVLLFGSADSPLAPDS
jgi:hypothetical protein